ncbi:MAG: DNA-protecting protein DprA [Chloroflexi bacterium]|nr:DNA-protecting protein DprA [Chloroflexota bacterium]
METQIMTSEQYPQRLKSLLGEKAPEPLYYWGNLELLNKPAVGFCGSRDATDKGLQVTADTAEQILDKGWIVVSGHAKGVDSTAHRIALENGGSTIIVLPEGFNNFTLRRELKDIAKPEQLLIISEYPPEARWTAWRAMQRNKTIIGLSDAMVLVQARMKGGTFAAGEESLKYKISLFVAVYQNHGEESEGNLYFLKRGAIALKRSPTSGRANISSLVKAVSNASKAKVEPAPVQTPLFELEKS